MFRTIAAECPDGRRRAIAVGNGPVSDGSGVSADYPHVSADRLYVSADRLCKIGDGRRLSVCPRAAGADDPEYGPDIEEKCKDYCRQWSDYCR